MAKYELLSIADVVPESIASIPSFRILAPLSQQPKATVYLCEDLLSGELRIVKHAQRLGSSIVDDSDTAVDTDYREFNDETDQERDVARLLMQGEVTPHPHVVQYLGVTQDADNVVLVMEHCANGDLFSILAKQPECRFEEARALDLFAQIAMGVSHLHGLGVAHRDLSLENVLVDAKGCAKVCDFGLSTASTALTRGCVGKLNYMAPEMVDGSEYDPVRADIWSLGILLFILLTGSPLFQVAEPEDPVWSALQTVGISGILTQWQLGDAISGPTMDLLGKMLSLDPATRFASVDAVLDELSA